MYKKFLFKDLFINSYSQKLQYQEKSSDKKNIVSWGQRKLLISEIEFFTIYYKEVKTRKSICVYVGAAPGTHIPFLSKLFPNIIFHLYDPRNFTIKEEENIKIFKQMFTDNDALKYKNYKDNFPSYQEEKFNFWKRKNPNSSLENYLKTLPEQEYDIYFISDIRVTDYNEIFKDLLSKSPDLKNKSRLELILKTKEGIRIYNDFIDELLKKSPEGKKIYENLKTIYDDSILDYVYDHEIKDLKSKLILETDEGINFFEENKNKVDENIMLYKQKKYSPEGIEIKKLNLSDEEFKNEINKLKMENFDKTDVLIFNSLKKDRVFTKIISNIVSMLIDFDYSNFDSVMTNFIEELKPGNFKDFLIENKNNFDVLPEYKGNLSEEDKIKYNEILELIDERNSKFNETMKDINKVYKDRTFELNELSDNDLIRLTPEGIKLDIESKNKSREMIWKDMEYQQQWVLIINPKEAFLKFKLPYYDEILYPNDTTRNYLKGNILFQAWEGRNSTETRLVPTKNYEITPYNIKEYEDILYYHNQIRRENFNYINPLTGDNSFIDEPELLNYYDDTNEIFVLKTYLSKYNNISEKDMILAPVYLSREITENINSFSKRKESLSNLRKSKLKSTVKIYSEIHSERSKIISEDLLNEFLFKEKIKIPKVVLEKNGNEEEKEKKLSEKENMILKSIIKSKSFMMNNSSKKK